MCTDYDILQCIINSYLFSISGHLLHDSPWDPDPLTQARLVVHPAADPDPNLNKLEPKYSSDLCFQHHQQEQNK